jgi:hypothetical protein
MLFKKFRSRFYLLFGPRTFRNPRVKHISPSMAALISRPARKLTSGCHPVTWTALQNVISQNLVLEIRPCIKTRLFCVGLDLPPLKSRATISSSSVALSDPPRTPQALCWCCRLLIVSCSSMQMIFFLRSMMSEVFRCACVISK